MCATVFSPSIIQSLLDLDAYKINMMQAIHTFYPDVEVRYELIVRSDEDLSPLISDIHSQIQSLAGLSFSPDDIDYLKQHAPHLKTSFLNTLHYFRFTPSEQVQLGFVEHHDRKQLSISIRGAWRDTILYETLVMAIISEVRSRQYWHSVSAQHIKNVIDDKVQHLKSELMKRNIDNFSLTEMGTRRRFSSQAQDIILSVLTKEIPQCLVGTSNIHFARKYDLTPIGTIAHEWFMGHQAFSHVADSQQQALKQWLNAFNGQLAIAPTDTISIDAFLNDFSPQLAKAYDGVRHDSGCPYTWGDKLIAHYQQLGIDPKSKLFIFSDGLNFDQALDICQYFAGRVNVSFGIGTFLTNDLGEYYNNEGELYHPLSIVVKLVECQHRPVAKISDEPKKAMCEDPIFLAHVKKTFNLDLNLEQLCETLRKAPYQKRRLYIAA
ncbi:MULTISPECIES: nicotinate phosphoribosyltransferase [unclassified Vibrio]|uniref:Nicotinate phosphoribosyltransferase n=1 Tax=Vibrio sp. HB236076 TaxID=3232307 RepID=A0AB39HI50_9VIBR|nr:nicotinate phosphoribosyltransferase [Vibrio sp. HB161653]MDP5252678.1 nicotinate phosphoribosyltransferase [Vibrio sp. HB161653]